jgi:hypothetical protein
LRNAWQRLSVWDRTGSGFITRDQTPYQLHVTLSHAQPRIKDQGAFGPPRIEMTPLGERLRAPLWFRKMDRNGDGDLSPSEFLGTTEQFRRMDTDGDGLIDVEEAQRADRWFRRQQASGDKQ